MSASGAPSTDGLRADGMKVAVVATTWHAAVMKGLVDGAMGGLREAGAADPRLIRVTGAFELPLAVQAAAAHSEAVVALGVVIRGGTPHFDYICRAATDGLMRVSLDTGIAIGFGLLTCDTLEQALDRAGLDGSSEDKGAEAAVAAISQALALRELRSTALGAALDDPL